MGKRTNEEASKAISKSLVEEDEFETGDEDDPTDERPDVTSTDLIKIEVSKVQSVPWLTLRHSCSLFSELYPSFNFFLSLAVD